MEASVLIQATRDEQIPAERGDGVVVPVPEEVVQQIVLDDAADEELDDEEVLPPQEAVAIVAEVAFADDLQYDDHNGLVVQGDQDEDIHALDLPGDHGTFVYNSSVLAHGVRSLTVAVCFCL